MRRRFMLLEREGDRERDSQINKETMILFPSAARLLLASKIKRWASDPHVRMCPSRISSAVERLPCKGEKMDDRDKETGYVMNDWMNGCNK